jgi:tRNA(Arg) A34 adenosine deaminase TadA
MSTVRLFYPTAQEHLTQIQDAYFMAEAIKLSKEALEKDLFPIAAIIVNKGGQIIGRGTNEEKITGTPLDHGEIVAIRNACANIKHRDELEGATIYTTCEPCPMCLGAIYWSKIHRIVYAASIEDTAHVGFNDLSMYQDFKRSRTHRTVPATQLFRHEAFDVLEQWFAGETRERDVI